MVLIPAIYDKSLGLVDPIDLLTFFRVLEEELVPKSHWTDLRWFHLHMSRLRKRRGFLVCCVSCWLLKYQLLSLLS